MSTENFDNFMKFWEFCKTRYQKIYGVEFIIKK